MKSFSKKQILSIILMFAILFTCLIISAVTSEVYAEDPPETTHSVKVSAIDVADGEELEGATLQILDNGENLIAEWTSTLGSHEITGLSSGVEYKLISTIAPDGYILSPETIFTIDSDGRVTSTGTITVDDTVLLVEFEKTHIEVKSVKESDNSLLSGVTIQIKDADDNILEEWESSSTKHIVEGLVTGKEYTMKVTVVPDSNAYNFPNDITFTIDKVGKITSTGSVDADGIMLVEVPNKVTTINTITLTGLIEPVVGQTPDTSSIATTITGITISGATWENATGGSVTTFEAGTQYKLKISFTVNSGYSLANDYALTREASFGEVSKTSSSVEISYTVPVVEPIKHVMHFIANGGTVDLTEKECIEGLAVGELPTPTRKGYRFKGWYKANYYEADYFDAFRDAYFSRNVLRIAPGGSIRSGLMKPGQYLVFDVTINNTIPIGADVNDNDLISGTDFIIEENRIFGSVRINDTHWNQWGTGEYGPYSFLDINCQNGVGSYTVNEYKLFKDEASSQEITSSYIMGTDDLYVTATWEVNNNIITFNTDGGSNIENQTVTTGNKATKPANPTKDGFGFGGWYIDSTCTTAFDFNTAIDVSMTLYAKWVPYTDAILVLVDGSNIKDIGESVAAELAEEVLMSKGLLLYENKSDGSIDYSNQQGKLLFTVGTDGTIKFAEGITTADNVEYELTNDEKASLASEGMYFNKVILSLGTPKSEYVILEGENQTYTKGSGNGLKIRASGALSKLVEMRKNGVKIDKGNYDTSSGSTIATLKSSYLDSLDLGTYKLTFVYDDGEVSTNFTIAQANTPAGGGAPAAGAVATLLSGSPLTGDNIIVWIIFLIISVNVFIATEVYIRKIFNKK